MTEKTVFALGFFDGLHLGHQALLTQCRSLADALKANAGVVTFLGHPDALVRSSAPPLIFTAQDRKKLLLQQFHMDTVRELPFDRALMEMPWKAFFHRLLDMGAAGVVCGNDFRFGYRGEGTAQKLADACKEAAIPCRIVPEQTLDGIRVSSTHIRGLLEQGKIPEANRFLGYAYSLSGEVVSGKQLGRTIGVPTANLRWPEELVQLPFGVYACRVTADGKDYTAVTNIGKRPTVNGSGVTVESWLQDFSGNLYGKEITVRFLAFLRPEKKFDSLDALRGQILRDAQQAKGW